MDWLLGRAPSLRVCDLSVEPHRSQADCKGNFAKQQTGMHDASLDANNDLLMSFNDVASVSAWMWTCCQCGLELLKLVTRVASVDCCMPGN